MELFWLGNIYVFYTIVLLCQISLIYYTKKIAIIIYSEPFSENI